MLLCMGVKLGLSALRQIEGVWEHSAKENTETLRGRQ
jgi:hypothetical protein